MLVLVFFFFMLSFLSSPLFLEALTRTRAGPFLTFVKQSFHGKCAFFRMRGDGRAARGEVAWVEQRGGSTKSFRYGRRALSRLAVGANN